MLSPKKVKHRKMMKGRMKGKAYRGAELSYGEFGLMKKVAKKTVPKVIKSYSIIRLKKLLLHEKSV